jgi:multiple sugar transport system substrate-binding protein
MMIVTACAGGNAATGDTPTKEQQPAAKAPEPVKLVVFDTLFSDEEFSSLIQAAVTKHYPHITLERIKNTTADIPGDLQKLIVGGTKPDVIFAPIFHYQMLTNLDIIADLSDRIKKDNVNVKAWNPQIQKYLLQAGDGKYVALPLYRNIQALFYNKSLFDQFGVPYPKDGMSYDQALDAARKMTRTQNGTEYYGLSLSSPASQLGQLSANYLDAKTNASLINTDPYKKVLELHKQDFEIPGMKFFTVAQGRQHFFKDKTMAMIVEWMAGFKKQIGASTVDWDMVTLPTFADKPNVHSKIDFHAAFVTKVSSHSDAAAQMIEYLSTNKDVQTQLSLSGRIPVIDDAAVLKQFGADAMKGKNIAVLQKTVMANIPPTSLLENQWAQTGAQLMNVAYNPVMQGKKDINTALREAAEGSNKAVQDFLGKK